MGGGLIRKVGVDFEEMGLIRKLKKNIYKIQQDRFSENKSCVFEYSDTN